MNLAIAVLMDPIEAIKVAKDSTFAMLLEAQRRGHVPHYLQQGGLEIRDGAPWGLLRPVTVRDDPEDWFTLGPAAWRPLNEMDVILARKDPPVDAQFQHDTLVLELTQHVSSGSRMPLVVNTPQALRDCNEKLYAMQFPQCIPPTLVARDADELRQFVDIHEEVVLKPLDGMGGRGIFRVRAGDTNIHSMLETLLGAEGRFVMAQKFIPAISAGDKRILLVDGEPVPYALARIPRKGEFRGNLAAGGRGEGVPLSDRDRWIVEQVAPDLRRRGLLFVGLDVIGDWLTEINVTSPTCIRELDAQFGLNIAGQLFDAIEARVVGGDRDPGPGTRDP
ncbi:MAG TPA: glutathione synthase [Rhodanobacteraceae bacterium]|nr:glutathione synthase [Rhodanobacteraceae bacterium]